MTEIGLPEAAALADTTVSNVENWLKRKLLRTEYGPGVRGPGNGRRFSRDNLIELSLIAALVRANFAPQAAAERTVDVMWAMRAGEKCPFFFILQGAGADVRFTTSGPVDSKRLSSEVLRAISDIEVDAFTVLAVGKIVARVDRYLADRERARPPQPRQRTKKTAKVA